MYTFEIYKVAVKLIYSRYIYREVYIMFNSSKISIHRFIATTLFRVVKEWPHSSGNIHE